MDLPNVPIIPKGRCPTALNESPELVDKLERDGVLVFEKTATGRKYTSFASLEAADVYLRSVREVA